MRQRILIALFIPTALLGLGGCGVLWSGASHTHTDGNGAETTAPNEHPAQDTANILGKLAGALGIAAGGSGLGYALTKWVTRATPLVRTLVHGISGEKEESSSLPTALPPPSKVEIKS